MDLYSDMQISSKHKELAERDRHGQEEGDHIDEGEDDNEMQDIEHQEEPTPNTINQQSRGALFRTKKDMKPQR